MEKKTTESTEVATGQQKSEAELGITQDNSLRLIIDNGAVHEELLLLTNQFAGKEQSKRKVVMLALDASAKLALVVIDPDANGLVANLPAQCRRAKRFTMVDAVRQLALVRGTDFGAAYMLVRDFLGVDQLPSLDGKPRIILATNSSNFPGLIDTVLGSPAVGIDPTCVELVLCGSQDYLDLIVLSRVVGPHSKAEGKERVETEQLRGAIAHEYERQLPRFALDRRTGFLGVSTPVSAVLYEWRISKRERKITVGVYFPIMGDSQRDHRLFSSLMGVIRPDELKWRFEAGANSRPGNLTYMRFVFPCEGDYPPLDHAREYAKAMAILVERTWPLIEEHLNDGSAHTTCLRAYMAAGPTGDGEHGGAPVNGSEDAGTRTPEGEAR